MPVNGALELPVRNHHIAGYENQEVVKWVLITEDIDCSNQSHRDEEQVDSAWPGPQGGQDTLAPGLVEQQEQRQTQQRKQE